MTAAKVTCSHGLPRLITKSSQRVVGAGFAVYSELVSFTLRFFFSRTNRVSEWTFVAIDDKSPLFAREVLEFLTTREIALPIWLVTIHQLPTSISSGPLRHAQIFLLSLLTLEFMLDFFFSVLDYGKEMFFNRA